jgi:hypothetical protein
MIDWYVEGEEFGNCNSTFCGTRVQAWFICRDSADLSGNKWEEVA